MTTGKTIALTRWTFVGKVMPLLFNMLSRLAIAFLPRSKLLLISWLQSPSAVILEPKKIKSVTVSTVFPCIWHDVMGNRCHDLSFMNVEFLANFFTLLFHFHQEVLQFLFTTIRVVSFVYLKLLIFLPAMLIPACASSSPAFGIMYCVCKLNKQGDNIQPDVLLFLFGTSLLFHVQF